MACQVYSSRKDLSPEQMAMDAVQIFADAFCLLKSVKSQMCCCCWVSNDDYVDILGANTLPILFSGCHYQVHNRLMELICHLEYIRPVSLGKNLGFFLLQQLCALEKPQVTNKTSEHFWLRV